VSERTALGRDALMEGARALEHCLEAQQQIYVAMLELSAREEAAIVAGDVGLLTSLVDEKEQLIEHLNALETERMTALLTLAAAVGTPLEALTLTTVAARLPAAPAASLTETGVQLRVRALALKEANERNALLLRSSRNLVDRWIHYLRTLLSGSLYTASGAAAPAGSGRRALDRSA
jgi:flagellar biosynthesis/type III secretory pathway chaperone